MYRPQFPRIHSPVLVFRNMRANLFKYKEPVTTLINYRNTQDILNSIYLYRTEADTFTLYILTVSTLEEPI